MYKSFYLKSPVNNLLILPFNYECETSDWLNNLTTDFRILYNSSWFRHKDVWNLQIHISQQIWKLSLFFLT